MKKSIPKDLMRDLKRFNFKNYDFRDITYCEDGKTFLINEVNRAEAESDIMLLNQIFTAAHKKESSFPLTRLYTDDIRFEYSDALEPHMFCHFEIYEKTPEDNTDYVLILHFYITPDPMNIIYGDIYYMSDGSIGKFNTVFEHENDIYYIFCNKAGNKIKLDRVICDKGKRKKRFYPIFKIGMNAAYFISGVMVIMTAVIVFTVFYFYDNTKPATGSIEVIMPDKPAAAGVYVDSADPETTVLQDALLKVVSFDPLVRQGSDASLKIQGKPKTKYDISVYYSSGKSTASGLENKFTDSCGFAEWNWRISSRTKTGTYKIEIEGGGEKIVTEIIITAAS